MSDKLHIENKTLGLENDVRVLQIADFQRQEIDRSHAGKRLDIFMEALKRSKRASLRSLRGAPPSRR
jgi:hypothetical protein